MIGKVPRNLSQQGNKFFSFTKYFYIIDVISSVSFKSSKVQVLEISKKQPEEKHPKKIIFSFIFMTISDYTFENQFHKFYNFVSFKSSNSKGRRQVLKISEKTSWKTKL